MTCPRVGTWVRRSSIVASFTNTPARGKGKLADGVLAAQARMSANPPKRSFGESALGQSKSRSVRRM